MSEKTYYQRQRETMLNRAKNYYENNKEALRDNAKNKLSEEEKKCEKRIWKKKIL